MPGKPSSRRRRSTGSVMTPRSSAITGSAPSSRAAASNTARPGPAAPAPAARVGRARGHGPVGDEAAEVVDPRDVEEIERPAQALGPPAIAAALQRRPVIQRVAPQLAEVGVDVRRRARHLAAAKQLGVREVVGAAGRDVDRHVADQADAGLRRVGAQRAPLAREAHLVGDRLAAAREALPVVDPERLARAEGLDLVVANLSAGAGEQASPGGERRAGLVRRSRTIRRTERQHLPPRLPGALQPVHEAVGVVAERAGRKARGMQLDSGRAPLQWLHVSNRPERRECVGMPAAKTPSPVAAAHPDRRPVADDRLRALRRQAHGRRDRAGRRRHLQRRPRRPARRRALLRARLQALAGAADASASTRDVAGDRWAGEFEVTRLGRYTWTIEAWIDPFAGWRDELRRKIDAGQSDLSRRAVRGRRPARAGGGARRRAPMRKRIQQRSRGCRDAGAKPAAQQVAALDPAAAGGRRAPPRPQPRDELRAAPARRRRSRARALRRLV